MGLSVEQMRMALLPLYSGSWRDRVMSWSPNRVIATYNNCVKYNTFEKRKKAKEEEKKQKAEQKDGGYYYQYEIFDYIERT